jgi:hypothetical protein
MAGASAEQGDVRGHLVGRERDPIDCNIEGMAGQRRLCPGRVPDVGM